MCRVRPIALLLLLTIACGLGACGSFLLGMGSVFGGRDPDDPVTVSVHEKVLLGPYDHAPYKSLVYLYFVSEPFEFHEAATGDLIASDGPVPGGVFAEKLMVSPGRTIERLLGPPGSEIYTHVGVLVPFFGKGVRREIAEIPTDGRLKLEFIEDTPKTLTFGPDDR